MAQIVLLLLTYLLIAIAAANLKPGVFPLWCYGENPADLSPAGFYYLLLSLPTVVYLLLRWVWQQVVWTLFLRNVAHLGLRLIPSHPDLMAGLRFVETSLRNYLPFGFAVGTIAAGGVANQMIRFHLPLPAFKSIAVLVPTIVVVICVGPLCTFFDILLQIRKQGIFRYGSLANRLAHQFEGKWLQRDIDRSSLNVSDFSATIDLYSVVGNVRKMRLFPFTLQSTLRLVATTLAPALPIALVTIPFDVLIQGVIKYLA